MPFAIRPPRESCSNPSRGARRTRIRARPWSTTLEPDSFVPKPATVLSDAYAARLRTFDRARHKLEALHSEGRVTRHDVSMFYEGIFLRTVTSLEGLMEDLFVGLLAGGILPGKNVHPRVTFQSHTVARDVMLGGRAYVDWLRTTSPTIAPRPFSVAPSRSATSTSPTRSCSNASFSSVMRLPTKAGRRGQSSRKRSSGRRRSYRSSARRPVSFERYSGPRRIRPATKKWLAPAPFSPENSASRF
jgi:hypothetical protein